MPLLETFSCPATRHCAASLTTQSSVRTQLTYEIDAAASSNEKTNLAQGRRVRKLTGLLVNVVVSGSARRFQLLTLLLNLGAQTSRAQSSLAE